MNARHHDNNDETLASRCRFLFILFKYIPISSWSFCASLDPPDLHEMISHVFRALLEF